MASQLHGAALRRRQASHLQDCGGERKRCVAAATVNSYAATPSCVCARARVLLCPCGAALEVSMAFVAPIPVRSVRQMNLYLEDMVRIYHCDNEDVKRGTWRGYDPDYDGGGGGGGGGDGDDSDGDSDGGDEGDAGDGDEGGAARRKAGGNAAAKTTLERQRGESAGPRRTVTCSACGAQGHNKKGCKATTQTSPAAGAAAADGAVPAAQPWLLSSGDARCCCACS